MDPVTEECILSVLGYLPEGPEDMTEEQKIALGQGCFGQNHQRQGPHEDDGMYEATKQCIIDNLGFMPDGKANLAQDQMRMIGDACFAGERGDSDHRGPDQGNGPGDLREEERQCVLDVLGFLPKCPEDLTDQQRIDLGRECFFNEQHGPPPTAENTQCIIDVLGYLPAGPKKVSPEQMALLGETCFANERDHRGGRDSHGDRGDGNEIDEAANQCIVDMLGFLPEHPEDLSYDDKVRVGAE